MPLDGKANRRRRAASIAALAGLALAGALAAGCADKPGSDPGPGKGGAAAPAGRAARKIPVEVDTVRVRDVTYTLQNVGSLQAKEILRVPARVAGVVQDIAFQEGTYVTPDKVLARIDTDRYRLAAQRAEATYQQAEAKTRETEAALAKRRALHEKDPGWVTDEELSNFTAQLDQARAAAAAAKAAYDLALKDLHDSEVRAEIPGLIDKKLVDTGQYLTAGTPVATMVDTRRLKLVFQLAESESVRLGESPRVSFRVKSMPGREFTAQLYHVGESADPNTRMVECLAWIDSRDRDLRPGSFADVTVVVEEKKGSVVVPQTAVLPTDRGFVAYVLKGGDEVEERRIRVGLYTSEGDVEILEGLAAGERLVVRGASLLNPASRVAVQSAEAAK
jgi:multidrug efflux system membrane fusion protein